MTAKSTVHQLLFQALLEIRERGHESGDSVVYHLADLFHNAVLQMERTEEGDAVDTFEEVLNFIHQRAKEKGCADWVDSQLNRLATKTAN